MSGSFVWYFDLMSTQVSTHLGLFLPSSGNGILSNYTTALISSLCHFSLISLILPRPTALAILPPQHTHTQRRTEIYTQRYTDIHTERHTDTHTHTLTKYWTSVSHSVLSDSLLPRGLSTEFCRQEC